MGAECWLAPTTIVIVGPLRRRTRESSVREKENNRTDDDRRRRGMGLWAVNRQTEEIARALGSKRIETSTGINNPCNPIGVQPINDDHDDTTPPTGGSSPLWRSCRRKRTDQSSKKRQRRPQFPFRGIEGSAQQGQESVVSISPDTKSTAGSKT